MSTADDDVCPMCGQFPAMFGDKCEPCRFQHSRPERTAPATPRPDPFVPILAWLDAHIADLRRRCTEFPDRHLTGALEAYERVRARIARGR